MCGESRQVCNKIGACRAISDSARSQESWRAFVDQCAAEHREYTILLSTHNTPTVAKVFENKFGQVVEKSSDLILMFVWFRENKEI